MLSSIRRNFLPVQSKYGVILEICKVGQLKKKGLSTGKEIVLHSSVNQGCELKSIGEMSESIKKQVTKPLFRRNISVCRQ